MNPDAFAFQANFTPVQLASQAARYSSGLKRNVGTLVVAGVIFGVLYLVQDPMNELARSLLLWFMGFGAVLAAVSGVQLAWARRLLGKLGQGMAIRIDPAGIHLATDAGPVAVPWAQISAVAAKNHQKLPGPELVVKGLDKGQQWKVPFSYLDVMPGSIDSAVRAHTQGRMQLDLSALDRVW